jgi:CO/xanthine dehydrogenase Mo-binding subunit
LPSVTDTVEAAEGKVAVWEECPDNISNLFEAGSRAATEAALAKAAHIIQRRYVISRVYAHFMEPRGAIGVSDPGEDRFTLYADVQYPHRVRQALATRIFKIPESKIRVIAGDVGGGFGTKGWQYPEHRLVLLAARKLRRPVKWTCERSQMRGSAAVRESCVIRSRATPAEPFEHSGIDEPFATLMTQFPMDRYQTFSVIPCRRKTPVSGQHQLHKNLNFSARRL